MAVTTVTVYKRDPATLPNNYAWLKHQRFQFTYEFRAGVSQNPCKGITFDGAHLWFCTDGDGAAAQAPRILKVDPSDGSLQAQIRVGIGNANTLLDIAFNGRDFYALAVIGGTYTLIQVSRTGQWRRTIASGLGSTNRAIAFDGTHIHTAETPFFTATHRIWDPNDGSNPKSRAVATGVVGNTGPGLVHLGHEGGVMVKGDPTLYAGTILYQFWDFSREPGGFVNGVGGSANIGNEEAPIAFDGAFVWEFTQAT